MIRTWKRSGVVALALGVGLVLVTPPRAHAQTARDKAQAAIHVARAMTLLIRSKHEQAVTHLVKAWKLYPAKKLPGLIARSKVACGALNKLIFHLKIHLAEVGTREARRIKVLLVLLQEKLRKQPPKGTDRKTKIVIKVQDVTYLMLKRKPAVQDAFYEYLTNQLVSTGVWQVVPSDKVHKRIARAKVQAHGNLTTETGRPGLGVESPATKSLRTTVTKIGSSCRVALMVYDLQKATGEKNGKGKGVCTDESILISIDAAVNEVSSKY